MQGTKSAPTVTWRQCPTYDDAKNSRGVVYLYEIKDEPFYWGKADRSFFGGARRRQGRFTSCGRYGPGYDHLVKAFLLMKGRLYIGAPDRHVRSRLRDIERYLIDAHGSTMQGRPRRHPRGLPVRHIGSRPRCLTA